MSTKWCGLLFWIVRPVFIGLLLVGFPSASFQSDDALGPLTEQVGFHVQFREETVSHSVMGVFVLAGEELPLRAWDNTNLDAFILHCEAGQIIQRCLNHWMWKAPEKPGLYPIRILHPNRQNTVTLNVFVLVPKHQIRGGYLKGYPIGKYPNKPYKNLQDYLPPAGLIEVTKENEETWLSPHFQLGQFVCKGEGGYPKYVILKEKLLLKLETILQSLSYDGFECETLSILSGYRTPHYNKAIGNVEYSRHIYGGAADIFIDVHPRDGMMDDLNKDDRIDFQDAKILYDHINFLSDHPDFHLSQGGLGAYDETQSHGPFVHVDVRGYRARWGL